MPRTKRSSRHQPIDLTDPGERGVVEESGKKRSRGEEERKKKDAPLPRRLRACPTSHAVLPCIYEL